MPQIESNVARLLQFKAVAKDGKRVAVIPTEPTEIDAADLSRLWSTDAVFRAMYADRIVDIEGWTPPDTSRAKDMPTVNVSKHMASPNTELRANRDRPAPEPARSKDTIEPTPSAGVPGNANQARASVMASMNPTQLAAWKATETRKTILTAIDERLTGLAVVPSTEIEGKPVADVVVDSPSTLDVDG